MRDKSFQGQIPTPREEQGQRGGGPALPSAVDFRRKRSLRQSSRRKWPSETISICIFPVSEGLTRSLNEEICVGLFLCSSWNVNT